MPRAPRAAVGVAVVIATALALAGCTGGTSPTTPSAAATAPSAALTPLLPVYPRGLTAAKAKSETVRAADAIQALIAQPDIVHVDDKSQLVAKTKTAGEFYGVIRAITLTKGFDVATQAAAMDRLLLTAGWTQRQKSDKSGVYAVLLSSADAAGTSLLVLKADSTDAKSPAITLQLVSPDLP